MKTLRTAPQILEHYMPCNFDLMLSTRQEIYVLKAMRAYARVKGDKRYEEGYQSAINQMK